MEELWSDDCEVLAWVVKRFESDGDPIMAGHVLNAFPTTATMRCGSPCSD